MTRFEVSSTGDMMYMVVGVMVTDRMATQYDGTGFFVTVASFFKSSKLSLRS